MQEKKQSNDKMVLRLKQKTFKLIVLTIALLRLHFFLYDIFITVILLQRLVLSYIVILAQWQRSPTCTNNGKTV